MAARPHPRRRHDLRRCLARRVAGGMTLQAFERIERAERVQSRGPGSPAPAATSGVADSTGGGVS
jgi:hypothetical protein